MFIDHFGYFIPGTPEWMGWIGRIAAPVFIYCVVIGFKNTSSKTKYLVRLGVAAVGMSFLNLLINYRILYLVEHRDLYTGFRPYIEFNFFSTLFCIAILIYLLENRKTIWLVGLFIWQFLSALFVIVLEENSLLNNPWQIFYTQTSGNFILVEGGILFITLGILFYFANENKWKVLFGYSFYCLAMFYSVRRWGWSLAGINQELFGFANYQWMMIFALPFLLLYNGKKGIGLKYLFYIFYPLHIVLLWYISTYVYYLDK